MGARCCRCPERTSRKPPDILATADHLQVPRQHGLFNHHGIDLGDGTVAHYLEGREILRSPIEEFCQGQPISVIEHEHASPSGGTLRSKRRRRHRHHCAPTACTATLVGFVLFPHQPLEQNGAHWIQARDHALHAAFEALCAQVQVRQQFRNGRSVRIPGRPG